MIKKILVCSLLLPLASAKFVFFHSKPSHIFDQVSHAVQHTVAPVHVNKIIHKTVEPVHVIKPIDIPVKKLIDPVAKETSKINETIPDKQIDSAVKKVADVPKSIDQKSIAKIGSDVGKAGEDAGKAIAQVPDDVSKGINTISSGTTDAIRNPAEAAKYL